MNSKNGKKTSADKALTIWQQAQRAALVQALNENNGNIERTSIALGISRPTVISKMKKYGLYQPYPVRIFTPLT